MPVEVRIDGEQYNLTRGYFLSGKMSVCTSDFRKGIKVETEEANVEQIYLYIKPSISSLYNPK